MGTSGPPRRSAASLPQGESALRADRRAKRTLQVVRVDTAKRRVRIHCIETDVLSWAKPERFNGKSGGYAPATLKK